MLPNFPSPVLSVATDAVRQLEGGDALCGLWTVFTKCKESLKDGRRLENISWRLWYREMATVKSYRPLTPDSTSSAVSDDVADANYFDLHKNTRLGKSQGSPHCLVQVQQFPLALVDKQIRSASMPSAQRPPPLLPPASSHSVPRQASSTCVGKIIVDMLPQAPLAGSAAGAAARKEQSNLAPANLVPVISTAPAVYVPSTPAQASAMGAAGVFPRVVVVNPTPHPTPPATPVPSGAIVPAVLLPASTHLLPPIPPAALAVSNSPRRSCTPPASVSPPQDKAPPPPNDDTLKASDRRFFLKQSPDSQETQVSAEPGSYDEKPLSSPGATSSGDSRSPAASHETRSVSGSKPSVSTAATSAKRIAGKIGRSGKGKDAARHVPARPAAMQRMYSTGSRSGLGHRKAVASEGQAKPRATFNIGSTSSNGSKSAVSRSPKTKGSSAAPPVVPALSKVKQPQPHPAVVSPSKVMAPSASQRRSIVLTSSDYETESDDESWESEDLSAEQVGKDRREDVRLREAALEAQRHRELFQKVPQRSYSNLDRTRSGLLTQLLKPDPNLFPANHPYRTSFSSTEVSQLPHKSGYITPSALQTSRSAAVIPLVAQTTAITAKPELQPVTNGTAGYYRPKGRPQGQELEDDSDSETENPDDKIQISRSAAQEKLAALVGRRRASHDSGPTVPPMRQNPSRARPALPTVSTAPIPLGHPYNLPPPAPPSTPRTTRRQMLATELSESLRRNLLWERQVSKTSMLGARRQASTGNVLGGGLRPLTSTTSEVGRAGVPPAGGQQQQQQQQQQPSDLTDARRRAAIARNRSWADDYHYTGW